MLRRIPGAPCLTSASAHWWVRLCVLGHRYCRRDDPSTALRTSAQPRYGLRNYVKVRIFSYAPLCSLTPHATSRHPDELYKNGIQRSSFVPCIELLKTHFEVTDLDSGTGEHHTSYSALGDS